MTKVRSKSRAEVASDDSDSDEDADDPGAGEARATKPVRTTTSNKMNADVAAHPGATNALLLVGMHLSREARVEG